MPQRPARGNVDVGGVQAADVLDGPQEAGVGLEDDRLGVGPVVVEAQVDRHVRRGQGRALAGR